MAERQLASGDVTCSVLISEKKILCSAYYNNRNPIPDGAVGIVIRKRLGNRGYKVKFPTGGRDATHPWSVQTDSRMHIAFSSMGTGLFARG